MYSGERREEEGGEVVGEERKRGRLTLLNIAARKRRGRNKKKTYEKKQSLGVVQRVSVNVVVKGLRKKLTHFPRVQTSSKEGPRGSS